MLRGGQGGHLGAAGSSGPNSRWKRALDRKGSRWAARAQNVFGDQARPYKGALVVQPNGALAPCLTKKNIRVFMGGPKFARRPIIPPGFLSVNNAG